MPTDPKYQYDVFISYKSEDRLWAKKLYDDLQAKGLEVFLDDKRLEAGLKWEPQLVKAIESSQHLTVVWSKEADRSSWVRKEITHFEIRGEVSDTRLIFILLEGDPPTAYESTQMIQDLQVAGAYQADVEEVDKNLWTRVVGEVEEAVRREQQSEPVLLAIFAMTNDRLEKVDLDKSIEGQMKSLRALLADLHIDGLKTKSDLDQLYHKTTPEWRPFGSSESVWAILEGLRGEINSKLKETKRREGSRQVPGNRGFHWELIPENFWQDWDIARRQVDRLESERSVIVIDPLSLYDDLVRGRFGLLTRVYEKPNTILMVLPPFEMLLQYAEYRMLVERMATDVFDNFFRPAILRSQYMARCNVNILDKDDIKQCLLTTLGVDFTRSRREPQPVALSV